MSANRKRLTERRTASPAPASYGWEPDHPAYQPDPEHAKYEKGDPSAWAEDVREGPYEQGPAPASYGWEADHPAAKADADGAEPSEKKAAMTLRAAVERKAAKCIRIAQSMLGKDATTAEVEDQALDLMDLPDSQIDSTLQRVQTAFLTADDMEEMAMEEPMATTTVAEEEGPMASVMAELATLRAELDALGGKNTAEEAFMAEEEVACGEPMATTVADEGEAGLYATAAKAGHDLFDVYDADGDGFITAEEWGGSMAVFAALDTDGDGILSRDEVAAGMGSEFSKQSRLENRRAELAAHLAAKASDEEEADEDEGEEKEASMSDADREQMIEDAITASSDLSAVEEAMLAEMLAEQRTADQNDPGSSTLAPDAHGLVPEDNTEMTIKDEDVDQAKVAVKADDDEDDDAEGDDAEGDESDKEAAAKASDEEEAEEEEAEEEGKEASFVTDLDPMGLSNEVEADDNLLTDLFGIKAAGDEEEAEEEEAEESDKEAAAKGADEEEAEEEEADDEKASSKKANLRPRGRKPSAGAKSLGSVTGKTASNEIGDLEKLWSSAPDVSNVFGS